MLGLRHLIGGSGINAMWKHRTKGQDLKTRGLRRLCNRTSIVGRLARSEDGTTAIEFGFIAIGLVYFLVGIIEFSMAMTVGNNNNLAAATKLSMRKPMSRSVSPYAR